MKITYDQETDTITIRLKDVLVSESDELQEGMVADFDDEGNIVGLEIFEASKRVTQPQNLIFESKGHPVSGSAAA
jgi:uncharacterized protein YuzE